MAEGLTVIAAGLVVVLCIILSMFVFIEVILKFDQLLRAMAARASSRQEAKPAKAMPATDPPTAPKSHEVAAAIGLALQRHLGAGVALGPATGHAASGSTPWAWSGRLEIMSERQRVISRRK